MSLHLYHCQATRCLIQLTGEETRDFLQGIVSNDMTQLSPTQSLFAGLLTPQGKYVADFIISLGPDDSVRLELATSQAADTVNRITMYRLRRKIDVAIDETTEVACVFGDNVHAEFDLPPEPGATRMAGDLVFISDPRHTDLGVRIYGQDLASRLLTRELQEASQSIWDALRIQLLVPEGGVDLPTNEWFPLDLGFERLHGVDFRKGCYVGQEVTARMHHKSTLRKGICHVAIDGPTPAPGSTIVADGKDAGRLLTVVDQHALAYVRWDRVDTAMSIVADQANLRLMPR